MGKRTVRILMIDDNPTIVELTKYGFTQYPDIIQDYEFFAAYDGIQGIERIIELKPDIIILDVKMPRLDGYAVLKHLRNDDRTQDIPVILLTCLTEDSDQIRGLLTGADDYITKPFKPPILVARIATQLQRRKGQHNANMEGVLGYEDIELDIHTRLAYRGQYMLNLTAKEFDLLVFFVRHPRQVFSRDTIIEHVWGFDHEGESINIVDVYVGYLRKKLEQYGSRLIQTKRGVGFVLKELKTGK